MIGPRKGAQQKRGYGLGPLENQRLLDAGCQGLAGPLDGHQRLVGLLEIQRPMAGGCGLVDCEVECGLEDWA